MLITRAKLNEVKAFCRSKNGLPYAYGGAFSASDPWASTDCSGAVAAVAAMLQGLSPYRRYGSTETWRVARINGTRPLNLVPAAGAWDVPADAILKVGFQHGGGGEYSHTACTLDGVAFESRGTPGVLYGGSARHWNNPLFHDFWYLPAQIVDGPGDGSAFPLPDGYWYGPYEGPEQSISGRSGEPQAWIDGLRRWQIAAGVEGTGVYDNATADKARAIQGANGLVPDGLIGPRTWDLVIGDDEMSWSELIPTQYNARGEVVRADGSNGPNTKLPAWELLSWLDGRVARNEGAVADVNRKLDQVLALLNGK
ncbi:peptidoglycan-binding domain-containing protein [Nocardia brasiliensis]|uniref:peptidoglycan-binding domain-containing protein n=2 Tax=Nocardia brasiliensis TaxID=37326 RepID=UPI002453FD51|nr:peptidoglycan-binding domain-containing protein [Nocardia brasiliensis]